MSRITISVICPLYEAEKEIWRLDESLVMQEGVEIVEVFYVLTKGKDQTCKKMEQKKILERPNVRFMEILKKDFSHSLTRETAAMQAKGEILVFLTQDVEIKDKNFLYKLCLPIKEGEADATYARQLTKYNNIEKYTR